MVVRLSILMLQKLRGVLGKLGMGWRQGLGQKMAGKIFFFLVGNSLDGRKGS
jgi:hypothetical protein